METVKLELPVLVLIPLAARPIMAEVLHEIRHHCSSSVVHGAPDALAESAESLLGQLELGRLRPWVQLLQPMLTAGSRHVLQAAAAHGHLIDGASKLGLLALLHQPRGQ